VSQTVPGVLPIAIRTAHGASGNAQECAPSESVEEAYDQHRPYVVGYRTWNEPDEVHAESAEIDYPAAVELGERRQEHGT